ncbi:dTDP-4-dehydrorhamnose reductase [Candidatus Parcubacteria bacterium]|jgi:dTDP-4-dehydrorhamnose reductase|nr:MAG: dTDP-4-dehydrorhamnose reductase [Candidatus Parcubacteria bacterium]
MKKVLVIGAKGMLGQEIVRVFGDTGNFEVMAWDRSNIDITDFQQVQNKIPAIKPAILINCAAYNNVDGAEVEADAAYLLNAKAVENLAKVCKFTGITFVHYSTDYVFSGRESAGYAEDAKPDPQSVYAKSKFAGEKAVQGVDGNFYLIRLSRLFGKPAESAKAKKSFVDIMLNLARTKSEIEVVDEEYASPTYATDLAKATLDILKFQSPFGIYHRTNDGACTWFEFAKEIFRQTNMQTKVIPVRADKFLRPAARPKFSKLISTKLPTLRPWSEALKAYLDQAIL